MTTSLLLSSVLTLVAHAAPAPAARQWVLLTSVGPVGTLTVTPQKGGLQADWRVDDNGRGPKVKEQVEFDAQGNIRKWDISGVGEVGAPVKESLVVQGAKAKWTSLDDKGEANAAGALYVPKDGSPWALEFLTARLLKQPGQPLPVLPGGNARVEKLRPVEIGEGERKETVDAVAVWGLDVSPYFVLWRQDSMVALLLGGVVLVEEKHKDAFAQLNRLSSDLSAEVLRTLAQRFSHRVEGPLWIVNARVFDPVTGTVSAPQNVGIYGDRIVHVGTDAAPPDASVVDAGGGTILPGLYDNHAHLGDWSGLLHVAGGVLLARDPGNDNETLLQLMARVDRGELLGPRARLSGFLEGESKFSANGGFVIDSLEVGKEKVRWYADHGFWGLKIYNSMNPDLVKPLAEEAHRRGLHVSGHVPAFMSSERAVKDGYDEINHINQLMLSFIIDTGKEDTRTPFRFTALGERMGKLDLKSVPVQRMMTLMKEKGTAVDPTMAIFGGLLMSRPGKMNPLDAPWLDHMPVVVQRARKGAVVDVKPAQFAAYDQSWKRLQETLLMLHTQGIPLYPGTDDMAGLVLHSELETWVQSGISPTETLKAATLGGARFLSMDHQVGSIARGKLADVYLVDGDPTKDIHAVRKGRLVVKGGVVLYPDEIHEALGIKPFAAHAAVIPPTRAR